MNLLKVMFYRLRGYKTVDELKAELQPEHRRYRRRRRRRVRWKRELERAQKLELALLPRKTRFPREGEVWQSLYDVEVMYIVWYAAPGSGSGRAVLPARERIVCKGAREPRCTSAIFVPIRYDELRDSIVAEDMRTGYYTGTYTLHITTAELNKHFRLVSPVQQTSG